MKVIIYGDNSHVTVKGTLTSITLGSDGFWVHLKDCVPGSSQQSFSVDHRPIIRPEEKKKNGKAFKFILEE